MARSYPQQPLRYRLLAGVRTALAVGLCLGASSVSAYDASLVWRPVPGVRGYRVYVSQGDQPGGGTDVGAQVPGPDGLVHDVVHGLPVNTTTNFWVKSYNTNNVESGFSNELSLAMGTVPTAIPGRVPTPTPSRARNAPTPTLNSGQPTSTPTATGTPNPKRAAHLVLSGYFFTRPTRHIVYAARYRNVKNPNMLTLTPPNLSVSKTQPSPNGIIADQIVWQNLHGSYGKVRISFSVGDQVLTGSTFSASASLTDSYGFVTNSSATVKVTHAAGSAAQ